MCKEVVVQCDRGRCLNPKPQLHQDADEAATEKQLVAIVGAENVECINAMCQLIFCEDRHKQ